MRAPTTMNEAFTIATALGKTGLFGQMDPGIAFAKIAIALDLGLSPTQGLRSIHIVEGKPELDYSVVGSLMKNHGYRWVVAILDTETCVLEFYDKEDRHIGTSSFTKDDAIAANLAGKKNWKTYARNMLFARALTNGARWFAPEVYGGAIYHRGEIDKSFEGNPLGEGDAPQGEPIFDPTGQTQAEVTDAEFVEDGEQGKSPVESGVQPSEEPSAPIAEGTAWVASVTDTKEAETSATKASVAPEPGEFDPFAEDAPPTEVGDAPADKLKDGTAANWFQALVTSDVYESSVSRAEEAGVDLSAFLEDKKGVHSKDKIGPVDASMAQLRCNRFIQATKARAKV